MYFSNLLSEEKTFSRDKKAGTMPFVCNTSEITTENCHVVSENGVLTLKQGDVDATKDLFMKGLYNDNLDEAFDLTGKKSSITYREIEDTAENPMIVVLASTIKLYAGVRTYIKYINIAEDAVLAMLVFGACEFTFPDGTSVPMQRCNSSVLDGRKTFDYTGSKMRDLSVLTDKESGYVINNDIVNAVIVNYTSSKGTAFDGVSYKTVKEHTVMFDRRNLDNARKKEQERKKKIEMEKALKLAQRKAAELEAKRKAKEKAEQEAKEVESQYSDNGLNLGAQAFLRAVGKR